MRISAPTSVAAFEQPISMPRLALSMYSSFETSIINDFFPARISSKIAVSTVVKLLPTLSRPASSMIVVPFSAVRVVGVAIIRDCTLAVSYHENTCDRRWRARACDCVEASARRAPNLGRAGQSGHRATRLGHCDFGLPVCGERCRGGPDGGGS